MCDLSFQPNNKTYGAILLCQFLFLSIFRIIIEKKTSALLFVGVGDPFSKENFSSQSNCAGTKAAPDPTQLN